LTRARAPVFASPPFHPVSALIPAGYRQRAFLVILLVSQISIVYFLIRAWAEMRLALPSMGKELGIKHLTPDNLLDLFYPR